MALDDRLVTRGARHAALVALLAVAAVSGVAASAPPDATAAATTAAADHAPAEASVDVVANSFSPFQVRVAVGGRVTWTVSEGGHSIVADDGRFAFGSSAAPLAAGGTMSVDFGSDDELVRYHCTIHGGRNGQGMAGVVVVGHPTVPHPPTPVIRVPQDIATVQDAIAAAVPGDRVEIAPGTYAVPAPLHLDRDRVTVAGTGTDPGDVRLVATIVPQVGVPEAVLVVTGANVTVDNLEVSGADDGVHLTSARAAALTDVWVAGAGFSRNGVVVTEADGAGLQRVLVRDVRRAGLRVEPCLACGVLVQDADVRGALVGILATGARGVVVRDSTLADNAVGVVARRLGAQPSVIDLVGNNIAGNVRRTGLPAVTDADRRLAVGAGVWLAGTVDALVVDNNIAGHTYGVVVSDGTQRGTVSGNTLTTNTVDLAWDGVGVGACFGGHSAAVSSEPAAIETLYPCSRPTVGVPYPRVNAGLLAAAYA